MDRHTESGWKPDPTAAETKSTKMNLQNLLTAFSWKELKRRTHVIRIFPDEQSALRLIRALAVEIHEDWIEAHRYLNMEMLREQRKQLQLLEAA
jgi:transposase-like protein